MKSAPPNLRQGHGKVITLGMSGSGIQRSEELDYGIENNSKKEKKEKKEKKDKKHKKHKKKKHKKEKNEADDE